MARNRRFARLEPTRNVPGKSALQATVGAVSALSWERINQRLLASARASGIGRGSLPRSLPGGQAAHSRDQVTTRQSETREDVPEAVKVDRTDGGLRGGDIAHGHGSGHAMEPDLGRDCIGTIQNDDTDYGHSYRLTSYDVGEILHCVQDDNSRGLLATDHAISNQRVNVVVRETKVLPNHLAGVLTQNRRSLDRYVAL